MIDIALNHGEKYYGAFKVINDATFEVHAGEKIGVVGRNGSGKSTLFRLVSGREVLDGGLLNQRKGVTVGYLEQIPSFPGDYSVRDVLNTAFENLLVLQREMTRLEQRMTEETGSDLDKTLAAYAEMQEAFARSGGYEMEAERSKVCKGLSIESLENARFSELSGGEKSRVALAAILLQHPDVLLLDEPTNHLDMTSLIWLETFLQDYSGSVLVISHDRYFLDRVAQGIMELRDGSATVFKGNYSDYQRERCQRELAMAEAYALQQKKIETMEKTIQRLHDWGVRADNPKFHRRAFSIEKRLEKIDRLERPDTEKDMALQFVKGDRSGREVLTVENLSKKWNGKTLFHSVNLTVRFGERVAILGPNGCGKTTLLRMICGELLPDDGRMAIGASVRVGVLMQETKFPNEVDTVLEHYRRTIPSSETEARSYLAKYLFTGDDVFRKLENLSGGERKRLALAIMVREEKNLLILDEPTNHLDIAGREALEEALEMFEGTIIFVSHDRYFVRRMARRIMVFKGAILSEYYGEAEDCLSEMEVEKPGSDSKRSEEKKTPQLPIASEHNNRKNKRSIALIEAELGETEEKINNLNAAMTQCGADYAKAEELYREMTRLRAVWEALWQEYIAMGEKGTKG